MYPRTQIYLAWFLSLAAIGGSLFYSEILGYPPCELCWYQRIFIYPLGLMLPISILREDLHVRPYALSLLGLGFIVAFYHNLLYYGVIEKPLTPCQAGVSCTSREGELFGFVGIPLMPLFAILAMLGLIVTTYKNKKANES